MIHIMPQTTGIEHQHALLASAPACTFQADPSARADVTVGTAGEDAEHFLNRAGLNSNTLFAGSTANQIALGSPLRFRSLRRSSGPLPDARQPAPPSARRVHVAPDADVVPDATDGSAALGPASCSLLGCLSHRARQCGAEAG